MKIEFIPISYHNMNDCAILAKWFNDPKINYLITPNFYPRPLPGVTPEYISQQNTHHKYEKFAYFIVVDHHIVGDVNITDNPNFLINPHENTSWLGITIGEEKYHNKGIGKKAMEFIEDKAKTLGYNRMELGVFSFNIKAIEFYKKLGYKQIASMPGFTYYNGHWYDDLRFEKYLT